MKAGDKAILCDGEGTDYLCEFSGSKFIVIESAPNQAEPTMNVALYQCLTKSDKFDFIVQKAVELGVTEIVPVISKRCVSRPKQTSGKVTRWNRIAYEAAKQCGRGKVPVVCDTVEFSEIRSDGVGLMFYECGGKRLDEIVESNVSKLDVIIGPEGGFEAEEVELAQNHGFVAATLGKRILRVDTASVVALSVIMNLTGNI
jgi:16S rRNA (uracil1498-N3)-methyltransferase